MKTIYTADLFETDPRHSHMVDSFAYAIAAKEAKRLDDYVLAYVTKKPWWMPDALYRFIISKVLVLVHFKENN